MKLPILLSSCALALAAGTVCAAPINMGGILTGTQLTTFDDVAGGANLGTNYDGALVSGGVSFGERFAGQINTPVNGFDVLSGLPTATLSLAFGAPGQNLNVATYVVTNSNVLSGLGPPSMSGDNVGEGSFAALFSSNQSEFGFDLVGGNGGSATIAFFRRDGSLIQSLVMSGVSDRSYTFQRDLGIRDIAGIAIFNNDPGGLGFDNLRFDVPSVGGGGGGGTVPEPGSLALAALALLGLGWSARRKA